MADVAVIGAGALGMAGARRLALGGAQVTVFEREPMPGGLTAGFKVGPNWLDKFYHHLFRTARRQIGMPWFWARIHDRTPELGYPRGGFQPFYEALADDIQRHGGRLETDCPVERIERRGEKVVLTTPRGIDSFDAVLCSLPTRLFL